MSLIVPEIELQTTLDAILATIKANWDANVDKTQTALYKLWNGVSHGGYDYYAQAQEIFLRTDANQRRCKVRPSYSKDKQDFPLIVVNVPNESSGGANSIGFDLDSAGATFGATNFTSNTSRSFEHTHSILVFSDNRNEVSLIYNTLKAFFTIKDIYQHLSFSGFENLKISGREMQRYDDIPNGTFIRALQLGGFHTQTVDELTANAMAANLAFNGVPEVSFSANGVTGVVDLTYVGGQGANTLRLTWTDNSDTTGNANESDILHVNIYNVTQDIYVTSDLAERVDTIIDIPVPSFATNDNIVIIAKFLKGDWADSSSIDLTETFIE